jgi:hypothetical protein
MMSARKGLGECPMGGILDQKIIVLFVRRYLPRKRDVRDLAEICRWHTPRLCVGHRILL